MNASLKKLLIKYGYFCLIIFALFLLLTLSTVLSRKSWTLGLKTQIQNTIDTVYPEDKLTVENAIQIEQPIAVSAACYKLTREGESTGNGRAVLVRVTGIAGPEACLYIRKPGEDSFTYVGVISDDNLYDTSFPWYGVSYRQITYWQKRIPLIIGEASR